MSFAFKKIILCTILILLMSPSLFSQLKYIRGAINLKENETIEPYLFIRVRSSIKSKQIHNVEIKNCQFKIDSLHPAEYVIGVAAFGEPQIFVKINLYKIDSIDLKFDYPPEKCPYTDENKICPFGHRNKIKRIRYGYPSSFGWFLGRIGIYHLGGDLCSDCDPKYYCKIHNLSF